MTYFAGRKTNIQKNGAHVGCSDDTLQCMLLELLDLLKAGLLLCRVFERFSERIHVWKGSWKMIERHMEMWQHANYITTLLDKPEACYEINQEIVRCLHMLASIGSGLSETHIDHGNAGWEWG